MVKVELMDSNRWFLSIDTLQERLIDQEEMSQEDVLKTVQSYLQELSAPVQITIDKVAFKEE